MAGTPVTVRDNYSAQDIMQIMEAQQQQARNNAASTAFIAMEQQAIALAARRTEAAQDIMNSQKAILGKIQV